MRTPETKRVYSRNRLKLNQTGVPIGIDHLGVGHIEQPRIGLRR